jgi:outer membrane biogenesis lipoprotein LolB
MKRLALCLPLLLAACPPACAVTAEVPPPPGPIVGKWTWTRSANNCTEVYDYRADGTLHVVSGEEESDSTYRLSARPDAGAGSVLRSAAPDRSMTHFPSPAAGGIAWLSAS